LEAYGYDPNRPVVNPVMAESAAAFNTVTEEYEGQRRTRETMVSPLYRIMKRMHHDMTLAKQWLAEFQAQGGAVPAKVIGFAPDIAAKPHKPKTRDVQARASGGSWNTFPSYREAAKFAGMEPDTVKLILAGNYTKKYKYEFRYLGGQVLAPKKGMSVMFMPTGGSGYTGYASISQCSRMTNVSKGKLSRALNEGKSYPDFTVYYQGLGTTTSDSEDESEEPVAKKKPLVAKPEQGPNLVEVDPPVKPPVPKTSRLPPELPSPSQRPPPKRYPRATTKTTRRRRRSNPRARARAHP